MSNSFVVRSNLDLTSLYGSTITLHVPSDAPSATIISGSGYTFVDGTTTKTISGYTKVGPNLAFSNVWNIINLFPFSNDFTEVESMTVDGFISVQSNVYIHGHTEVIGSISTFGPLITNGLSHKGIDAIHASTLVSTVQGLGRLYISGGSNFVASTMAGLGSVSYISSTQLPSTIDNLGSPPYSYVSANTLLSSIQGLGSPPYSYISTPSLVSTVQGLGSPPYSYISTASLQSTILGMPYLSSAFLQAQVSTVVLCNGTIPLVAYSTIGDQLRFMVTNLGYFSTSDFVANRYISTQELVSTVQSLGTFYISTPAFLSAMIGVQNITGSNLISTVAGLGSIGYVSSLAALTGSASSAEYVTDLRLYSTVAGLGNIYISSPTLISTVAGLGGGQNFDTFLSNVTRYYVTTTQSISTVAGLGSIYLSTPVLTSTIAGLGFYYLSAPSLQSSMSGLLVTQSNFISSLLTGASKSTADATLSAVVSTIVATGYTTVPTLSSNGYIYSVGGTSVANSSNFYEDPISQATVSYFPIISLCNMSAPIFKTIGYGSNYILGDGSYITMSSDKRLKEGVEPIPSALDKITGLRGVYYTKLGDDQRYIGCIAQEVEEQFPEVITVHPSIDPPNLKSMKYELLTAPLVESVKELMTLRNALRALLEKDR